MEKARIYWHTAQVCCFTVLLSCLLWLFLCCSSVCAQRKPSCLSSHQFSRNWSFLYSGLCDIEMSTEWTTSQPKPENLLSSVLTSVNVPSENVTDLPHTWQMYRWATETESNAEFHTAWTGKKAKANFFFSFKDCTSKETVFWVYMRGKRQRKRQETSGENVVPYFVL